MSGFMKWCKFACSYAALRYSYHTHYAKIEEYNSKETTIRDMLFVERIVVIAAGCAFAPSFAPLMMFEDAIMFECKLRGIDNSSLHQRSYTKNHFLGHL